MSGEKILAPKPLIVFKRNIHSKLESNTCKTFNHSIYIKDFSKSIEFTEESELSLDKIICENEIIGILKRNKNFINIFKKRVVNCINPFYRNFEEECKKRNV